MSDQADFDKEELELAMHQSWIELWTAVVQQANYDAVNMELPMKIVVDAREFLDKIKRHAAPKA